MNKTLVAKQLIKLAKDLVGSVFHNNIAEYVKTVGANLGIHTPIHFEIKNEKTEGEFGAEIETADLEIFIANKQVGLSDLKNAENTKDISNEIDKAFKNTYIRRGFSMEDIKPQKAVFNGKGFKIDVFYKRTFTG